MKTLPLVAASLKEFMRDRKSLFFLLVLPLVIIALIFASFSPKGLQKIPIGVVENESLNISAKHEIDAIASSFLIVTPYADVDACLGSVKAYHEYVCITATQDRAITLTVLYDNTRTPIIWEVVGRIQEIAKYVEKKKSREMASSLVQDVDSISATVHEMRDGLQDAVQKIDYYTKRLDGTLANLEQARTTMYASTVNADAQVGQLRNVLSTLESSADRAAADANRLSLVSATINALISRSASAQDSADLIWVLGQVQTVENALETYQAQTAASIDSAQLLLNQYDIASAQVRSQLANSDAYIRSLKSYRADLTAYRAKMVEAQAQLSLLEKKLAAAGALEADDLVNPVRLVTTPVYVPTLDPETLERLKDRFTGTEEEKLIYGLNLISMQTLFPALLMLVAIFLSLLVSSFICLKHIHSSAKVRISLISHILPHELIAIYISSLAAVFIPVFAVIVLGQYLFLVPILDHILPVSLLLFLLCSAFIFIGMIAAYVIRQESMTLLLTTFLLIFLLFFSGFLLPVERMNPVSGSIATAFPGKLALTGFTQVTFYNLETSAIAHEFTLLALWCVSLAVCVLLCALLSKYWQRE